MRNYSSSFKLGIYGLVTVVCCCFGTPRAVAQEGGREYVPFVEEGKIWYCGGDPNIGIGPITPEHPEGEGIICVFSMCGDTLINDRKYEKVYCQFGEYYGDEEQHYYCAIREEAHQVFIIETESEEEKLLYDFRCPEEIITLTYNDIKFARTAGYRRYRFLPGQMMYAVCIYSGDEIDYTHSPGFWVEGVGCPGSNPFAFEFSKYLFNQPKLGRYIFVRTCMKDGKYIFSMDWMSEPIDTSSIVNISDTNNSPNNTYYDLQGRRLTGEPGKGIYIQNGRKIMDHGVGSSDYFSRQTKYKWKYK